MRPLGIQRRQGAGGRFFRVEDSNPAIVYDGQWSSGNVTIGDDNDASIHTSTQPGSTIKFTFHGACFVLLPIPPCVHCSLSMCSIMLRVVCVAHRNLCWRIRRARRPARFRHTCAGRQANPTPGCLISTPETPSQLCFLFNISTSRARRARAHHHCSKRGVQPRLHPVHCRRRVRESRALRGLDDLRLAHQVTVVPRSERVPCCVLEQAALDGRGGWHLDRGRVDLGRDRRDDVLCVLSTRAQGPTSAAISQGEAPRHHLRW